MVNKKPDKYIIGVDAGGTSTRAALFDAEGQKLSAGKAGVGNMVASHDEAMQNIASTIRECLEGLREKEKYSLHVYVGAAGIHAGNHKAELKNYLQNQFINCEIKILDDAMLALYAATKGKDGILLIAGTGSIAYGKKTTLTARAGGWGNVLGDEGSGYDISRMALKNITTEFDSGQEFSLLSQKILQKLGTDIWGMVKFAHSSSKGEVASLLPLVSEAAATGGIAAELLKNAGKKLATLTKLLYTRIDFDDKITITLKGGVLENIPLVRNEFCKHFEDEKFIINQNSAPAELGAYYIHLEEDVK